LPQNKWAIVDAHNFHWLSQWNWCAWLNSSNGRWYAVRSILLPDGRYTIQRMARVIMGVIDSKVQVDHKDRVNTLDNRESNLRLANSSQNNCNKGKQKNNTSGFKGVYCERGQYRARIRFNGALTNLGFFDTAIEAAAIWNWAARKYHGEFAYQNDLSQITA
jgi:hypothetical protein